MLICMSEHLHYFIHREDSSIIGQIFSHLTSDNDLKNLHLHYRWKLENVAMINMA